MIISNEGKTNINSRLDFHASLRHRHPELCSVGAVALYFFSMFHIIKQQRPDFAPKFIDPGDPQKGRRFDWHYLRLFPAGTSPEKCYDEMSPQSKPSSGHQKLTDSSLVDHRNRVNALKLDFDLICQKVTHIGRVRAAEDGMMFGATIDGVKSLGLWSRTTAFDTSYNRSLPLDAMLATAHFDGQSQEGYFIARATLGELEMSYVLIHPLNTYFRATERAT